MKVDVIIPTYNRAHVLARAIDSVLCQRHRDFELFVVDDGSSDGTNTLVQSYQDPRIHYLYQENAGVSSARNLGITHSHSEWIAFLDSDDEWLPQKLIEQVSFSKLHPDLRFIHSDEIWIRNGVRVNPKKRFDKSNSEIFRRSLETCLISPSTVFLKRDLLLEKGLFDTKLEICEDYDLWLRILATEEIGFIPKFLIQKHGGHDDQLSTKFFAMDQFRIESLAKLFGSNLDDDKRILVAQELRKKTDLLLKGYEKHGHSERSEELRRTLGTLLGR